MLQKTKVEFVLFLVPSSSLLLVFSIENIVVFQDTIVTIG